MISPRSRTDHVPAPVLFRLPNLQPREAAPAIEPTVQATATAQPMTAAPPLASPPPTATHLTTPFPPQPNAAVFAQPHRQPLTARLRELGGVLIAHRDLLTKPQVMLGLMLLVAFGAWLAGRQTAARSAVGVADALAADTTVHTAPSETAPELNSPVQTQPEPADAGVAPQPSESEPSVAMAEEGADFYVPEEEPTPQLAAAGTAPPADEPPSATSETPLAETESVETTTDAAERFAELSSEVLNPPAEQAEVAAVQPAAPPETQPEPAAATPEATQVASAEPPADATAAAAEPTASEESDTKKLRRILSRTPHDIPDWTKYLIGSQSSVKAASASGVDSQGMAAPKNERAYYYQQD